MPPWGRPSGGSTERRRRDREREAESRRQWEQQNRFQDIDDESSDEGEAEDLAEYEVIGDNLAFTGFDMGAGSRRRRHERGLEQQQLDQRGYAGTPQEWQAHMLAQQEDLLESALRRIRRARLRGDQDVNLTRDELDALERTQMVPQEQMIPQRPMLTRPTQSRRPSGDDRRSLTREKTRNTSGRLDVNSRSTSSSKTPPPAKLQARQSLPVSPSRNYNNASPQAQDPYERPSMRSASARNLAGPPSGFINPQIYDQALSNGYQPRSSSRSSQRSLPDDPDWVPMSRTRGATTTGRTGAMPNFGEPAQARRNVSGPAATAPGISHAATQRRPSPLPNTGAVLRVPVGRVRGPAMDDVRSQRLASGLKKEVIEISSESDAEEENEEDYAQPVVQSRFAMPPDWSDSREGGRALRSRQ
jgi:hypothetical protein